MPMVGAARTASWLYMTVILQALGRPEHLAFRNTVRAAYDSFYGTSAWDGLIAAYVFELQRLPTPWVQWQQWDYMGALEQQALLDPSERFDSADLDLLHVPGAGDYVTGMFLHFERLRQFAAVHHDQLQPLWPYRPGRSQQDCPCCTASVHGFPV